MCRAESGVVCVFGENRQPMAKEAGNTFSMILTLLKGYYWFEDGVSSYVRSRGWPEFTRPQSMLMSNIVLGYRRPSEMARQLGISRQAVHITIQQMIKKGIVALIDDPKNRHIKQVVLTKIGEKMRDDGLVAMEILAEELGRRIGWANVSSTADVLRADWGPSMKFGAERGEITKPRGKRQQPSPRKAR